MSTKTISVLVPVYNGADTLARCIESVLAQDYPDFELLVVDDCSTDGTPEVIDRYRDRMRTLRNPANSGIARTYNRALSESSGEIVFMIASDCGLSSRDYLSRVVKHFDDPSVGAVTGKAIMPDFDRAAAHERIFTRLNLLDVNEPDTAVHQVNFVEVRCDAFRRSVLEAVGGLNEDLFRSNEDQDLSIRIARNGYSLLQDNSLAFELGFGGTEDSLGKLLSKQGQYANGQAYITVNYGVGSRQGLWTNENRRLRALHRMSQVASVPITAAAVVAALLWAPAWWVIAAMAALRGAYYYRLASDLRPAEKLAAMPLGLCCDAIYSTTFMVSTARWVLHGKSALNSSRAAGDGSSTQAVK